MDSSPTDSPAPVVTVSALKGFGNRAYCTGLPVHKAPGYAEEHLGRELDATERLIVMHAWCAERNLCGRITAAQVGR